MNEIIENKKKKILFYPSDRNLFGNAEKNYREINTEYRPHHM